MIRGKPRQFVLAVEDLTAAIDFLKVFGFSLRFRDGAQWAVTSSEGMEVALASGSEAPPNGFAITYRTDDLNAAIQTLAGMDNIDLSPITEGAHERRVRCTGPGALSIIVYESKG